MSTICPFYEWDSIYLTRNTDNYDEYQYIYINKTQVRISKTNICYNNYSRWGIMPFFGEKSKLLKRFYCRWI